MLSPGRPAKLGPVRILCFLHMADNLFVIILVRHFLEVSSRNIGLILVRSQFHSFDFGIGNMVLVFQKDDHVPLSRHREKNSLKIFLSPVSSFFNIS